MSPKKGVIVLALVALLLALPLATVFGQALDRPQPPPVTGPDSTKEDIADWQARLELARLLSYMKNYHESLKEYEQVLREKPDLVEAKMEMARVLFWSGQQQKAFNLLKDIPREKMDDETRKVLADLYAAQKKYDPAIAIYRAHLEKHPDDLKVRLSLADLLSWAKHYQESLEQFEIILKARPDDLQVRRKYAIVLSWAGRKSQAAAELRKTLGR
jgi:tetratricopeptide (TPR) repeat protein